MNNVLAMNNSAALFSALMYVFENGQIIKPRGDVIREIRDFQIRMHPQFPFNPFVERKYNVDYFKTEMRWKLGASKFDASIIEPFIAAAGVGLSYSWYKYRANILDPTKETPEKFEWTKAASTTILAVIICVVFQALGATLGVADLDPYIGLFAGLSTGTIEPGIKAVIRWFQDQKLAVSE